MRPDISRRRAILAVMLVLGAATVFAGAASAASPVYPVVFSGTSARGAYNVQLDTGCNPGLSGCVASPTYLYVNLSTPAHAVGGCPANTQFPFNETTLKKDGSFSVTQAYGGGRTMSVSGRFTSARSVHGTVSGNKGCAAAAFTITLPKPFAPVAPVGSNACYWLTKAHASSLLGGAAKPRGTGFGEAYSAITGLGRCDQWTQRQASTNYGAHSYSIIISQDTPDSTRGFPKPLDGLGPGAISLPNLYGNAVFFKIGSAWVALSFEIPSAAQPPAATIAAQQVKLITIARRVYALMRRA
jgi:hypothetical protein